MAIPVTGISDVPTETLEIILDFLHDDSSALYSSSLVVRNWLPSPRYHLFNRILLNEVEQWGGRVLQANVRSFLTLIRAEHCTFLSYVQCIVLNVTTQTLIDEVVNALVPLKKLSQIVLMHHRPRTNRDHASGRLIAWNGRFLHNVRDFTVNALTDFGYDAWALVASFANLRSLAIYIPERIPFVLPSPPHIPPSTFRNLRTLRLQLKGSEELLTWMQAGDGEYCALETFDLWLYSPSRRGWGPVTTLNSFLKNISDTLRHLGIGIVDYDTMADDSVHHGQHIDLGPLNLESLFLSTHDIGAVCDTLESVGTSLELEALTVNASTCQCSSLRMVPKCSCASPQHIARLGSILEHLQLNKTTRVTFNAPKVWAQETVSGELTMLEKRAALKLSYCGDMYNKPVNSFESLGHLMVWRNIRPGSQMRPDGSYELLPRNTSSAT